MAQAPTPVPAAMAPPAVAAATLADEQGQFPIFALHTMEPSPLKFSPSRKSSNTGKVAGRFVAILDIERILSLDELASMSGIANSRETTGVAT